MCERERVRERERERGGGDPVGAEVETQGGSARGRRRGRPITVIAATNRPTTAINTSERLALQMSL